MQDYLNIAQIVISVGLIGIIMMQVRGGGLGGIFGNADTVYRSKRGLEKTMFQFTIVLIVLFVAICLTSLYFSNNPI